MSEIDLSSAALGFCSAIGAGLFAHFLSEWKELRVEKRFQKRVLRAIYAELTAEIQSRRNGIVKELSKIEKGDFLKVGFCSTQDYFTVFNSNCEHLGKMDETVSSELIYIYNNLKASLDQQEVHQRHLNQFMEGDESKERIQRLVSSTE